MRGLFGSPSRAFPGGHGWRWYLRTTNCWEHPRSRFGALLYFSSWSESTPVIASVKSRNMVPTPPSSSPRDWPLSSLRLALRRDHVRGKDARQRARAMLCG